MKFALCGIHPLAVEVILKYITATIKESLMEVQNMLLKTKAVYNVVFCGFYHISRTFVNKSGEVIK